MLIQTNHGNGEVSTSVGRADTVNDSDSASSSPVLADHNQSTTSVQNPSGLSNFLFGSFKCPFQDYFTHRDEPIDRWGETGVPRENQLTHPQAELFLSHMWPVRGSNLHQTQR